MVKILPQLFYETPEFKKLLVDGLSCIVHKKIQDPVWHKEGYVSTHAITLVLKGLLRVENEEGFFAEVPAGKMIFLPKGLYTISDILPQKGEFEAVVFFFDQEIISQFVQTYHIAGNKQKSITHFIQDYTTPIRHFTESLLQIYGGPVQGRRELTALKLMELLHLIQAAQENDCFATALSTLHNKERRGLREFMQANFSKPLSIEDYAYLTGRTLSTFRRDFKAQFGGLSPKQWLIEKRLDKARELLARNHTTVADVVAEIGYENIPHFIKAFHKRYGISPKQFLIRERKEVLV